jgi:hypothetical protein
MEDLPSTDNHEQRTMINPPIFEAMLRKAAETERNGETLAQSVSALITAMNNSATNWRASGYSVDRDEVGSSTVRISDKAEATAYIRVDSAYSEFEGTPNWLSWGREVDLQYSVYDVSLDEIDKDIDIDPHFLTLQVRPLDHDAGRCNVTYESGEVLSPEETLEVIKTLDLLTSAHTQPAD